MAKGRVVLQNHGEELHGNRDTGAEEHQQGRSLKGGCRCWQPGNYWFVGLCCVHCERPLIPPSDTQKADREHTEIKHMRNSAAGRQPFLLRQPGCLQHLQCVVVPCTLWGWTKVICIILASAK